MIREERSRAFWHDVATHSSVAPIVGDTRLEEWLDHPSVFPLASANGGFFLVKLDGSGLALELHAMFKQAGRGRESHQALCETLRLAFGGGAQLITAQEQAANPLSRPPLTFGFRPATLPMSGPSRLWLLTADQWAQSKACSRSRRCLQS